MANKRYNVAVVGATGAVGREMISILEERSFPLDSLKLYASGRSAGEIIKFLEESIAVQSLSTADFRGIDLILSSPGSKVSLEFASRAVKAGAVVVDNTSAFRMDSDVPLVVPEVNEYALSNHKGLIANPNCTTIQLVVVLKPIHDRAILKRVIVSSYQSVSGMGRKGMDELSSQCIAIFNQKPVETRIFPHQIAFNCIPQIDSFLDDGYSKEEMKVINETRKIMSIPELKITATTVRVPVFCSHSESINIETEKTLEPSDIRELLSSSPGIIVEDNPSESLYPMAVNATSRDPVFVGRIRKDYSCENAFNLWIVADNLRKGAALNAVQIAESLIKLNLL
jgi:aspartate-semialdehyde dehydrogenase